MKRRFLSVLLAIMLLVSAVPAMGEPDVGGAEIQAEPSGPQAVETAEGTVFFESEDTLSQPVFPSEDDIPTEEAVEVTDETEESIGDASEPAENGDDNVVVEDVGEAEEFLEIAGEAPEINLAEAIVEENPEEADSVEDTPETADESGDVGLTPPGTGDVPIDAAHFPDADFRAYLMEKITGGKNVLKLSVAQNVKEIDVGFYDKWDIGDLTGIAYFPNLEKLNCRDNSLSRLDVSKNRRLKILWCDFNSIDRLDLSKNTLLTELTCSTNQLASLDLSRNTALTSLECDNNRLTSLNLTKNTVLQHLDCQENRLTSLTLGKHKALRWLYCYHNSLHSLNLSGCLRLVETVKKGSLDDYGDTREYYYDGCFLCCDDDTALETGLPVFNASSVIIGVKEKYALLSSSSPVKATECKFSVKPKKYAKVSSKGVFTASKKGAYTVTVRYKGHTLRCKVVVKKAPSKITLSPKAKTLNPNDTFTLKAKLPSGTASKKITWSSKNKSIAKVSSSGKVTALKEGTTYIYAKTYNGKKAKCKVKVVKARCRALLIGQVSFDPVCNRNRGDCFLMKDILDHRKAADGSKYLVYTRYDQTRKQILNDIDNILVAKAKSTDVSLFFIATHGNTSLTGSSAGQLAMIPSGTLLLQDLANALARVPGKVIVIIESCGSGAAVYQQGVPEHGKGAGAFDPAAFDRSVIDVFSRTDPGVLEEITTKDAQGHTVKTGEFCRKNKFYVLTASAYQEMSWGGEYSPDDADYWNLFPILASNELGATCFSRAFWFGVKDRSGTMNADTNGDKAVTLNELFNYIAAQVDYIEMGQRDDPGYPYYQHVQVYPKDSGANYVLFRK